MFTQVCSENVYLYLFIQLLIKIQSQSRARIRVNIVLKFIIKRETIFLLFQIVERWWWRLLQKWRAFLYTYSDMTNKFAGGIISSSLFISWSSKQLLIVTPCRPLMDDKWKKRQKDAKNAIIKTIALRYFDLLLDS